MYLYVHISWEKKRKSVTHLVSSYLHEVGLGQSLLWPVLFTYVLTFLLIVGATL